MNRLYVFLILFCFFSMRAQEQNTQTDEKRNLVKMNLTGVVFGIFSLLTKEP